VLYDGGKKVKMTHPEAARRADEARELLKDKGKDTQPGRDAKALAIVQELITEAKLPPSLESHLTLARNNIKKLLKGDPLADMTRQSASLNLLNMSNEAVKRTG
jgi:hypothetical protein